MPDPLAVRVLDAVRAAAETVSAPDVPAGRVYRRAALEVVPARDGPLPVVVVAPTPGRPGGRSFGNLSKRHLTYPVTVMLVDAQGGRPQAASDRDPPDAEPLWRAGWADAVADALEAGWAFTGVAEFFDLDSDGLALIDTSAYQAAGLLVSTVSVVVTCRVPMP